MTNYPAEYAPHWQEFKLKVAIKIFFQAIKMMTWKPWKWAKEHYLCVDLPSAWWMACHSWDFCKYEKDGD